MRIEKLVVVGVGLIGGSCALALRRAGAVGTIVGVGRTAANLDDATRLGVVDRARRLDEDWTSELRDADVVLVAAPVAQCPALFAAIAPAIGAQTVVTDAGSTKQDVIAAARATFGAALPRFVPGHPIAGTEHTGAAAAFATLFSGRNVILTPLPETAPVAIDRITALWLASGARRRDAQSRPARRDLRRRVAPAARAGLRARGRTRRAARRRSVFRPRRERLSDFTRIAGGSPEMWRDIALANRDALLAEIDRYGAALHGARTLIANGDGQALAALFQRASLARRAWEAKRAQPVVEDKG